MTIGVISLGCVKNRVDTEQMLALLTQAGHTITPDPAEADILIVNTCGFIDPAKEESIRTILEMAAYKQSGRCKKLIVTGCLAQRYGDALLTDMPEIDALLGVSQYDKIVEAVNNALEGSRPDFRARRNEMLECGRMLTTPPYSAYVRIGEGCNNRCAYCAIPLIRGSYRSRNEQAILDEARMLTADGAKELILISQDTTRYGSDSGSSLRQLVRQVSSLPGVEWLRVLYMYPDETDIGLLEEMAAHDNVCKYLDLPLQHASDRLLRAMNRRGTVSEAEKLLTTARAMGFTLRTTFIVGFPGETEEDFNCLLDFVRRIRFDRMGAFAYSPEEGTVGASMPDQVPEEIKQERLDRLMTVQAEISQELNEARVGTVCRVLVTGFENGLYVGRSAMEAPDSDGVIYFTAARELDEGEFVSVRLVRADTYDLYGILEEDI
ncbi:MAG: 30S ribosomal protein S12 methylthiotransferase RimO [Clostridia bacterium]|nr:30S ribosomal protein S12 methylthiotransferase RimO [Clostridia bacterium]